MITIDKCDALHFLLIPLKRIKSQIFSIIGKKILEEAGEVWLAAEHESDEALSEEISQLIYHLQVLMLARGLTINDVYKFL